MEEFILGGLVGSYAIVRLVFWVLNIIGLWRVFEKMGRPGWKGLIPVYNTYNLFDALWLKGLFWLYLVCSIVMYWNPEGSAIMAVVVTVTLVVAVVMEFTLYIKLAHSFGKGTLFGVLTYFISPLCIAILGFGSARYQGKKA